MKKLFSLFIIILCLCSCATNRQPIDKTNEYIEPLKEVNFFNELNTDTKTRLLEVYGSDDVGNNLLEMMDTKLIDCKVKDHYGKTINFADFIDKNIVIEIVQYSCEHCFKQIALTEEILNKEDVVFIQYFAIGNDEQIDEFYKGAKRTIPKDLIVIPENDELGDFVSKLKIDLTPTFVFFNKGIAKFAYVGELSYAKFLKAYEFANTTTITKKDLVNKDDVSVFDLYRGYDDVLNDLSTESKNKLALIDNSEELTVKNIGTFVDFNTVYELGEKEPLYTIKSYKKYINEPLVVFYVGYIKDNLEEDVAIINEFALKHKDLNMLSILMDTKDIQTSSIYKALNLKLETDVVSSDSEVVKQFIDALVITYPAALFIQDNIYTGGVYDINDSQTIENAYNTFIGENSIALLKNN